MIKRNPQIRETQTTHSTQGYIQKYKLLQLTTTNSINQNPLTQLKNEKIPETFGKEDRHE